MTDRPDCPNCGQEIPADAPSGRLCPRCLLRQVLRGFEEHSPRRLRDPSDVGS